MRRTRARVHRSVRPPPRRLVMSPTPSPDPGASGDAAGHAQDSGPGSGSQAAEDRPSVTGALFSAAVLGFTRSEGLNSPRLRWSIGDQQQRELGSAQLEGKGAAAKATRYLFGVELGSSKQLAVFDGGGTVVLGLAARREGRVTTIHVARGDGRHLGTLVHHRPGIWRSMVDAFRHAPATPLQLVVQSTVVGAVHQDDNTVPEMVVHDAAGNGIARLVRSQRRAMHGARPIVHHDYRLEIAPSTDDRLRGLLVALPLAHDLVLGPDRSDSVFP
jgi:hypothetical protein